MNVLILRNHKLKYLGVNDHAVPTNFQMIHSRKCVNIQRKKTKNVNYWIWVLLSMNLKKF